MTPGQQKRRDTLEEDRRIQQADEKVRELREKVDQLRYALQRIRRKANEMDAEGLETRGIWLMAHSALDGGGGADDA